MRSVSVSPARIKFWGTRGSIGVPGVGTVRYGGNTTCVEVRADGEIIVLDAGSGIRPLGSTLRREFGAKPIKLSLLITHAHWDHVQDLPFFSPVYAKKNQMRVLGDNGIETSFSEILAEPMKAAFFPVAMRESPSRSINGTLDGDTVRSQVSFRSPSTRKSTGFCFSITILAMTIRW